MSGSLLKKAFIAMLSSLYLAACAGPVTPLGAVWKWRATGDGGRILGDGALRAPAAQNPVEIAVQPNKQVLHGPSPIRVWIKDPKGDLDLSRLLVRYNGLDVSESFAQNSTVRRRGGVLEIENRTLSLTPNTNHFIEFMYQSHEGSQAYLNYLPPSCLAFRQKEIKSTGDFRPTAALLSMIERNATQSGLSPVFLSGLIARESGFNSRRVSWNKAIGLTQITSLAEKEIIAQFKDWPRYPGVEESPASFVKVLVLTHQMNRSNEWRLDPLRSIQGGIAYALKLAERWSTQENKERLQKIFPNPAEAQTQLVLASYHSGYARVQSALDKRGLHWLESPALREARKYVNSVTSYCEHFSESASESESKTEELHEGET